MNIRQNINEAKNIANNRLQMVSDSDSQISIENENNTGLPLNDVVTEDDIYKGDI